MSADETCFMCDLEPDHCADIISEEDRSIHILAQKGLLNFDLKSEMNGIGLCASCHFRYDDQSDPRLVFYPQDIDFFILFELRDRARRSKDGSLRTVPTAAQYATRGGLYTRIVFGRKRQDKAVVKDPARWDGAPLGALKRAFDIMGCPRADGIPEDDMQRLRDLWDLYHRNNDNTARRVTARYGFSDAEEDFGLEGIDLDNNEQVTSAESPSNDQGGADVTIEELDSLSKTEQTGLDQDSRYNDGPSTENPKYASFDYRNWCWQFGPKSTSNQKAKEFTLLGPGPFGHSI